MTRARDLANLIGSGNFTTETLTATAGQTAFTPSNTFTSNFLQVFYNGLLLDPTVDYTENGTTITLTVPATAGDEMEVVTYNTFSVGDAITQTEADNRYVNAAGDTMTGNLSTTGNIIAVNADNSNLTRLTLKGTSSEWSISNYGTQVSPNNSFVIADETNAAGRFFIDSAGRVTTPYQPSFMAYNTITGNVTYNAGDVVAFPNTLYNTGGHYNTSNGRFTAPVAGLYHFSAYIYNATSGYARWTFRINGNYALAGQGGISTAGDQVTLSASFKLSAGDYVALSSNYAGQVLFHDISHTAISGYLIG